MKHKKLTALMLCFTMMFSITSGIFSAAFASDSTTGSAYHLDTTTGSGVWSSTTESAYKADNSIKLFSTKAAITSPSSMDYSGDIGKTAVFNTAKYSSFLMHNNPASFNYYGTDDKLDFDDDDNDGSDWDNDTYWLMNGTDMDIPDVTADNVMVVVGYYWDEVTTALWYQVEAADGSSLPAKMTIGGYDWLLQDFTDPELASGNVLILSDASVENESMFGKTVKFNQNQATAILYDAINGNPTGVAGDTFGNMVVKAKFTDNNGIVWYYVDAVEGETWPAACTGYHYVKADMVEVVETEEEPIVIPTSCTTTVDDVEITVEGNMLSGSTLFASAYEVTDPGSFGLTDTSNIKASYDIKILNGDGKEIQPEGSVFIIMDAAAMGLSNGDVVEVIHQHGSTIETSTHVVISGKLIFPVSGFSVFIVDSTTETTGTEITGNSSDNPYVMTVGESKIFFDSYGGGSSPYTAVTDTSVRRMYQNSLNSTTYYYFVDGVYKEVNITRKEGRRGNYTYTISYADGSDDIDKNLQGNDQPSGYYYQASGSAAYRGEWQVTDESNAISYETTSVNYQNNQHMAPYITVTAKDVGLVTLTYKYVNGNSIKEETLYISVVAPVNGLYVDDQVAEIGCLVPAGLENIAGVTYTWTRSDGQIIRSEALNDDGTVNVSLDRGGLTEGRDPITYTVTATLTDGTTQTASYEVLYSNEILNTSFETPALGYAEGTGGNKYVYNGYPGMYWKTTAPGSSTSQLTQDIEMIQEGTWADTYFGVQHAADGSQYVELNAENFGALYQDILTTPDATLSWAFSHNGRTTSGSNNTMYVIVAAAKDASSIIDENSIDGLIDAIPNGANVPSNGEGYKLTYNGATYYVWKHIADNNANTWERISGSYSVPEGQYLTRLFFASETNTDSSIKKTMGNLIDAVSAGETMAYKIEYYVDGNIVNANTQTGSATVYTSVGLEHLQGYLNDGYVLTAAKIQLNTDVIDYPGNVNNGLYITGYGESGNNDYAIILKVYLAKHAVTITKNIVIEGWAGMTDDERKALIGDGLTAGFELESGDKTYNAALTIIAVSSTGELTTMGEFVDSNGNAPENGEYTVSEKIPPQISKYKLSETVFNNSEITISNDKPTAAIVCTNTYEKNVGDLSISKTVTGTGAPADAVFTFTVSGGAVTADQEYTYTVGNETKTATATATGLLTITMKDGQTAVIKDLNVADYQVVESNVKNFTMTAVSGKEGIISAETMATASFTNNYAEPTGTVKITKTVVGLADYNVEYTFRFDAEAGKSYSYTIGSTTGTITSGGTLKLQHGETAIISNVQPGSITVTEQNVSGFTTAWSGAATAKGNSITCAVTAGQETALVCTNTYTTVKIAKTVVGANINADKDYTFTVDFNGNDTATEYPYTVYENTTVKSSSTIKDGGVLTLKHNQYAIISNVPAGNIYIEETPDQESITEWTVGTLVTGNAYKVQGTVTVGQQTEFVCTNTLLGSLKITKTGSQSIDENQSHLFHVSGNGQNMDVVIHGNGFVIIKGLKPGDYFVTEKDDWSWRYTATSDNDKATVPAGGIGEIRFSNTRSNTQWLDGGTWCDNWFGVGTKEQPSGTTTVSTTAVDIALREEDLNDEA